MNNPDDFRKFKTTFTEEPWRAIVARTYNFLLNGYGVECSKATADFFAKDLAESLQSMLETFYERKK